MPRGRRVNSSGEKSKRLLLDKAIELFSTHGYHQTKISDIVKAADLTQPTFYLYFQSKESLFNDLNERFQNDLYAIFSDNTVNTNIVMNKADQTIQQHLQQIFDYFTEHPKLTKIGFYESKHSADLKATLVNKLVTAIERDFEDYDLIQEVDKYIIAESLLGSMERLTLTLLLTEKSTAEKLSKDITNIYFANARKLVR